VYGLPNRPPVVSLTGHQPCRATQLLELLDPSRFTLLVAHANDAASRDAELGKAAATFGTMALLIELAPVKDDGAHAKQKAALGRQGSVFLVRPDGYVALTSGSHSAAGNLAAWHQRWLSPEVAPHAA